MSLGLHQFRCFALTTLRRDLNFAGDESHVFRNFPMNSGIDWENRMARHRLRAASVSGSGAEYSEQLPGIKWKQTRPSIAGIDQDELLDPELLADPDSSFYEFKGVKIHHKICHEEQTDTSFQNQDSSQLDQKNKDFRFPMILLHGFGASVFSWDRVMKPLAQLSGSKVLAFDRPAFGLTSRLSSFERSPSGSENTMPLNPYSMAFSMLATLSFIDLLAAEKAILMGHSAGCLVAVNTYFEAPERVAALILVAPAIVAPLFSRKVVRENQRGKEKMTVDGSSNINTQENPFARIVKILSNFYMYIARVAMRMLKGMMDMASSLYKNTLSAILRSTFAVTLVRMIMDKFGIPAIRNAWYDANKITDQVIHGYTRPLKAKGWDRALLEYTLAMFTDSASESKPPLSKRLAEISCPVLVITGDTDRLVPSWNAEKLSRTIPGSQLEVIKNCGHLPHEEKVDEFISAVNKFLQRVFGDSQPQHQLMQAAT
eukprot:TRINITY_DN7715_c0_g1_i1.p1 TRINITY_DN7715_c0_g1~~TRINITY_DN7715_c0_g1_i1.p1  ORF type:complete len:486 (+),score=51.48 TRINITY_DN7715_c0_g1_i1:309-1766(+)